MSIGRGSTSAALRYQGTLGVVSACAMVLSLAYGRVFAVALHLPFARAVTGLAVLGLPLGGVLALLLRQRFTGAGRDGRLVGWLAAFGFAAPFCQLMVVEHVPIEQTLSAWGLVTVLGAGIVLAIPFVLAGTIGVAMLLPHGRAMPRLWAIVLVGAAGGALLAVACFHLLPANVVALLVGAAVCWLALLLAADAGTSMRGPLVAAGLLLFLGVLAATQDIFRFYQVKAWNTPYTEHVVWSPTSRVGVFPPAAGTAATTTLPLARGRDGYAALRPPEFTWLDVDGANWTAMLRFDGDLARAAFLLDSVVYAAHRLRRDGRVLVVGVGGGRDLLAARVAHREVVGIEPNPAVRYLVDERFAYYSGRPYALDGVSVVAGAPRRVLPGLTARFDVVQLSTPTAGALLPFLDDEGYLVTRDAFREYFRALTPEGVVSVTRGYSPQNPVEILRLLATVRDAWTAEGAAEPSRHMVVLLQEFSATVLARREPYTPADLAAVDRLATETGMAILFDPRRATPGTDDATVLLGAAAAQLDASRFDVRPTTDDWPFFAQPLRSAFAAIVPDPFGLLVRARDAFAMVSLLALLGLAVAAVCLAAALRGSPAAGDRMPAALLGYFLATGWGAASLVLPVLERLRLLAGSELVALVAGAGALGLAAAAGSVLSSRLAAARGALAVAAVLAVLAAVVALALPLLRAGGGSVVLAAVALVPVGVLLGMVVPLGIRAAAPDPASVAAAVTLHAAGTLAAVTALVALAMRVGMTGVAASGALAFGVAAACLAAQGRRPAAEAEPAPSVAVG